MSLDTISGAVHTDTANYASISRSGYNAAQSAGTVNISINESQASTKTTGNGQSEQGTEQKDKAVSDKQIKDVISKANNTLKEHRTRCEFSYHEDTNRVSIKVIDRDSNDVIKEIPPEETLEMVEKMWELAGLLVDEKR
jgi:flagellar protein FlaG